MSQKESKCCKKTSIGGQALMEGIMMRGPETTAMAVRNAAGQIILETSVNAPASRITKIPFLRGIVNMASSLKQGYKYLMRSADIALADIEAADREKAAEETPAEKAASEATEPSVEAIESPAEATESPVKAVESPAEAAESPTEGVESPVEAAEAPDEAAESPAEPPRETVEAVGTSADTSAEAINAAEKASKQTASEQVSEQAPEQVPEQVPEQNSEQNSEQSPEQTAAGKKKNASGATTAVMVVGVLLGLLLAIGLFVALPSYLYLGFAKLVGIDTESKVYGWSLFRSFFEGVIKIAILVGYMALVSLMKDIRRVFMYHGAEHKTIFCYEHGLPLTVENVRIQRRLHPRCGTSFLILVLIVSIILGFFIPSFLPTWLRILIKIALLPLVVGIGYELIKLAGRKDNLLTKIISAPGMWLQKITTREPDDAMIECAIAAMNEVIPADATKDNW